MKDENKLTNNPILGVQAIEVIKVMEMQGSGADKVINQIGGK